MWFHRCIVASLTLYSFASSKSGIQDGFNQQPIVQPKDNFTLTPIRDALVSNKVIGDVLNDFEPLYYLDILYPKNDIRVSLGNEIALADVDKRPTFGIYQIPKRNLPPKASRPVTFTLIMTDPDATSRYNPKLSEMCHWIVTNITSSTSSEDILNDAIKLDLHHEGSDPSAQDEQGVEHKMAKKWKHKKHRNSKKPKYNHCRKDKKGGKCQPGELVSYYPPSPPPKTGWHRYVFVLLEGDATHLLAPTVRKHWGYKLARHGIRDWAIENKLEIVGANFYFAENEKQF